MCIAWPTHPCIQQGWWRAVCTVCVRVCALQHACLATHSWDHWFSSTVGPECLRVIPVLHCSQPIQSYCVFAVVLAVHVCRCHAFVYLPDVFSFETWQLNFQHFCSLSVSSCHFHCASSHFGNCSSQDKSHVPNCVWWLAVINVMCAERIASSSVAECG